MKREKQKKKLFDAFVSMVLTEQLPIKKVTVTRITAKAGVNRRTFYTHFEDVYDLHRQLQNCW
ncbi:TetR/AcrR family transcriptional regulator [Secundilactobacillus kimchicus]|uniref:TetR/AcrR family transcriptional regulator n=1 Tax=Secundilactobacillus kimchicus TaxID=528209 RepID=UPI0006D156FF|nr:TetR/AcrR family transcriptional regulator [Secundilactobacillus kimchicus]